MSQGSVGNLLYVEESTVKAHVRRMLMKTGTVNTAGLVTYAILFSKVDWRAIQIALRAEMYTGDEKQATAA